MGFVETLRKYKKLRGKYENRRWFYPLPAPPPLTYSSGRVSQRLIKFRVFGDRLYPNRCATAVGRSPEYVNTFQNNQDSGCLL
jgi:hypothetical protein